MPFIVRASSLAGFLACDMRAAFTRLIAEGRLEAIPEEDAPYANLGTVHHWKMQQDLNCRFAEGAEPPTEDERRSAAARFFGGDLDALDTMAIRVSALVRRTIPTDHGGHPWRAEDAFRNEALGLSGHTDLLSEDRTELYDLKTTSRKPAHNRPKAGHVVQMIGYKLLIPELHRAHLVYADAQAARWVVHAAPILFDAPEMQIMLARVREYIEFLRGPDLLRRALPRIGEHCETLFCDFRHICRDLIVPPAAGAEVIDGVVEEVLRGSNPFA